MIGSKEGEMIGKLCQTANEFEKNGNDQGFRQLRSGTKTGKEREQRPGNDPEHRAGNDSSSKGNGGCPVTQLALASPG